MNDYRVNLNYAKALFMLAQDLGQTEVVLADIRLVHQVCSENHLLNKVLDNPVIPESKKHAIVNDLFNGKISATTLAFLLFVVHKKRAVSLKGISESFMDLYRDANNIVLVRVKTATEVNKELLQKMANEVEAFTNKKVELESVVSDKMLGGFQLTFDTYLYDARIRTRVDRMRREFAKNVYESKL